MQDIPKIRASSYNPGKLVFGPAGAHEGVNPFVESSVNDYENLVKQIEQNQPAKQNKKGQEMSERRIVQVFIVDPDEKMPLKESLLYKGDVELTDSTNEELFFEIEIKSLLIEHNKRRREIEDKKADSKEKKYLEPIRIRELSMTVVNIAEF